MLFKQIFMTIVAIFFVLGIVDLYIGKKIGLAGDFEKAMSFAGRIILSVAGIASLAPVLAEWLKPVITPVFTAINADPAMFATILLAPDCGGYSIAVDMATSELVGRWAGSIVSSLVGSAISFTMPVAVGIVEKENYDTLAIGILFGFVTMPVGCFIGGFIIGVPFLVMLINLVPIIIVCAIIVIGLIFFRKITVKCFIVLGKIMVGISYIGLTLLAVQRMTGLTILEGMRPLSDTFVVIASVVLNLGGILVMTGVLFKILRKPLKKLGKVTGISEIAILDCLVTLSSLIQGCVDFKEMNRRGQYVFAAMAITATSAIGAHLGFIGVEDPEMLMPMMVAKISTGLVAAVLVFLYAKNEEKHMAKLGCAAECDETERGLTEAVSCENCKE